MEWKNCSDCSPFLESIVEGTAHSRPLRDRKSGEKDVSIRRNASKCEKSNVIIEER